MNKSRLLVTGVLLIAVLTARVAAATTWSTQDYDLYTGDFNGDGIPDLLYIAKAPGNLSGIAVGVSGGGFDASFQSWPSNYLGIPWSGNPYNVIILQNKTIANPRADILLQSKAAGGNSYLLQPNAQGRIVGISQPLGGWSADQYHIVSGDFNHDGLADVFLQATTPAGTHAITLADGNGQFTSGAAQTWTDGFLGFRWASSEAIVYAGDFNGDGYTDLLVQARPRWVMIDFDVPFPVPTYPANMNGIAFAHSSGTTFSTLPAPGETLGYFAWSRNAFGVDWSPLVTNLLVGQFNGSPYSDVLLQALHSSHTSYLVSATGSTSVFATGAALAANVSWSADTVRLIAGNYGGTTQTGIYFQALTAAGTNAFATSITGSSVSTTTQDPTVPPAGVVATAAGRTPGTFTVSSSGGASYSIPLWTPPGLGQTQLRLALNYNSHAPNGVLGTGWSLSGLSAITRCNATWAQNGAPQGVTLTTSDRLCLDGQQLKVVSGSGAAPAQGGTTYATEIEGFAQITANGSSGAAPTSFTVTTKNGLIYDYGLTSDSQIEGGPSAAIRTWALSQIRDRVGNAIKLSYYNDAMPGSGYTNGSYRIKEIDYPYTATGQGPFYRIQFSYQLRPTNDIPSSYLSGYESREPNELTTILEQSTTSGGWATTKQYNLVYTQNAVTSRIRLATIQECSAANCLPLTTVNYQAGVQGWPDAALDTGIAVAANTAPVPIDLNGDGLTDLLYAVSAGGGNLHWWVRFATPSGYSSTSVDTALVTAANPTIIPGAFAGSRQTQFLAVQSGYWYVYSCSPTAGCTHANTQVQANGEVFATDYDGDGLPDLVSAVGNSVIVRRNITTAGGAVTFNASTTTIWTAPGTLTIVPYSPVFTAADFNGDGRADILVTTAINTGFGFAYQWNVLLSHGFGAAATATTMAGSASTTPLLADWNGDGCSDIVSTRTIYISNCAGAFTAITPPVPNVGDAAIAVDWDGDGRADLVYDDNNTWYVLRSTGDSFATPAIQLMAAPVTTSWFPLDQNGDGLADLAYVDTGSGNEIRLVQHGGLSGRAVPADLATSFSDGLGIAQSLSYVPISQGNHTLCSGSTADCPLATFPEQDYQGALYVVNQFTASDGTGSTYQNQFWYYGAKLNAQGRGFEGFYARRASDSRIHDSLNQLYTYEYFAQAFPFTGMLRQRLISTSGSVALGSPSGNVSFWTGSPASQALVAAGQGSSETRYFPFLQTTTLTENEYGALGNAVVKTTATTNTYGDGFGNATNVQVTVTDNDPNSPFLNQSWTRTVATTYLNDAAAGCFGLPTLMTVQNSVPGQTAATRTYSYTPDANHSLCREHVITVEPNTAALNATETVSYDGCGNINQLDVVGHNPNGTAMATRTTKLNYSYFTARCQFAEAVTNALSQTETVSYQYDFGVPLQATDANGIQASWSYDDFGRKIRETRPDNTFTTWSFKSCASAPCWGVGDLRFMAIQGEYDSNGGNYRTQDLFFDGLGRLRYDESNRALGTWTVNRSRVYDALGRVSTDYRPYALSGNGYWSFSYDLLNRKSAAVLYQPSGGADRTISWSYAGRKITSTDPLGNTRSQITDVSGLLRRITDPLWSSGSQAGATTSYDYDAFGNRNKVTDPIGAVSSATYNLRGFATQLIDADAGTWNYQGDSLNELVSWQDNKNQSFSADYDSLGRLFHRYEPEGTSTWTWGSTPGAHDIGSLDAVSGYGYTENRVYDTIGRLQTVSITTDQTYQYDYAYNSIGAIDTITYPTSTAPTGTTATRFKIQYGYSYGFPAQISDVTQSTPATLWSLAGVNDYSSPTAESLGGVVSISSGYKPWTDELTSIQSGVGGSGSNRQNLSYQWDTDGNLSQRQDNNQGVTENFGYDALNRLWTATLGSGVTTTNYDAAGNISSRTDVGASNHSFDYTTQQSGCSYTGLPTQPHAVRNAGGGSYVYCYDANGNVVSRNGLTLQWASYNLPTSLQASVGGTTYSSQFLYGPNHQRYQQSATYSTGTEVTAYAGGLFEKVTGSDMGGITAYRNYVPTPGGSTLVVARNSDGTSTTTYDLSDHLGSSDALVNGTSGSAGTLLVQESFAAFGQRRSSNWAAGGPTSAEWAAIARATRRGFAFQEELDNIGLVHMNGRVYDPNVGRFLSVDPLVGNFADTQSLNPYTYVSNRPLSAADPSGYLDVVTVLAEAGSDSGGDPYVAGAEIVADILFGFLPTAAPPPPPATALVSNTAQSASGADPCSAAGPCGTAASSLAEVTVTGTPVSALGPTAVAVSPITVSAAAIDPWHPPPQWPPVANPPRGYWHWQDMGPQTIEESGEGNIFYPWTVTVSAPHSIVVAEQGLVDTFQEACELFCGSGIVAKGGLRLFASNAAKSVWRLGWSARGATIESMLGGNLPRAFPVVDSFSSSGVAASIKSIDLNAVSYQNLRTLENRLNGFVNKLDAFEGASFDGTDVLEITSKQLILAVPEGAASDAQLAVINAAITRAESMGITVIVVAIP